MRFGVELPCGGEQLAATDIVELGVAAEAAGWDGVFLEDYLVYYRGDDPPTFDPWVLLTAIAARTTRVWLGTTVSGLLARDPIKLAREAATLDELAPGRVVLGVGLGDPNDRGTRLRSHPIVEGPRGTAMDRRLGELLDLLSGRPVPQRDNGSPVMFRPSAGRVRVWGGESSEAGAVLRRAGRADGIVPYKLTDTDDWSDFTTEEVALLAGALPAAADRPGRAFDIAVGGRRRHDDLARERAAIDAAARGGATWWLEFVPPERPAGMQARIATGPVLLPHLAPKGMGGS